MDFAAWSCISHFDGVGGVDGSVDYEDSLGGQYGYDSNVINYKQVAQGDILVVRDRDLIYGFGVVVDIKVDRGEKKMSRCPVCRSADVKSRKQRLPRFRCPDCKNEFDAPLLERKDVEIRRASYGNLWFPLPAPMPARALLSLYVSRDQQNAIRRLDVAGTLALLQVEGSVEGYLQLKTLAHLHHIESGRVEAMAKRRIGQQNFRSGLLERYGPVCAVTGSQPEAVLDAAHLQSFAEVESHDLGGGLLLRADVHRMFDRFLLTFNPSSWQSCVAPGLIARHSSLNFLHDKPIAVPAALLPNRDLIKDHFRIANRRWSDGA